MPISSAELAMMEARLMRGKGREIAEGVAREVDLHNQIIAECNRRGWLVIHGRTDCRATVTIGSPDFVILADRGRTIYVEAKARKAKPTMDQQAFHAWARRLGHQVFVIRNFQEFLNLVSPPTIEAQPKKTTD